MVDQTWKHSLGKWERIGTQQSGGNRALLCFLGNVEGTEEIPVCHHFRQCGTNKKKKNTHSHGRVFGEDENPREERKRRWDNPPWYVIRTIRDYEAQCASLRERERERFSLAKPNQTSLWVQSKISNLKGGNKVKQASLSLEAFYPKSKAKPSLGTWRH